MIKYSIYILTALLMLTSVLTAQEEDQIKQKEEVKIQTSAQCGMCKERIEEALSDVDGIISAELDLETKIVKAVYEPEEIDADEIRERITKVGYDADDMPANKRAYRKLPKCCQKGGHD